MILIRDKYKCCGCSACEQICPKHCIILKEDIEGFSYPEVDKSSCIDCHLCEKVCPVINQSESIKPLRVYAAKNPSEKIRMESSSGGIFTMFAERTINNHGVVFGARFNSNWEVIHDYTETIEGLLAFRGSKYVQSQIGNNYLEVENFLKQGREVLFSGTPCQIAGLHKFLGKKYEGTLITVDMLCHGVPSPLVWREYLKFITHSKGAIRKNTVKSKLVITGINFRDKSTGWKKYGFVLRGIYTVKSDKNVAPSCYSQNEILLHETLDKNIFIQGFLKNLYLRPSCYHCPSKAGKSESDITIADFWGISEYYRDFDDDKGVSLIMTNSHKGESIINEINFERQSSDIRAVIQNNPAYYRSPKMNRKRKDFYIKIYNGININAAIKNCLYIPLTIKLRRKCSIFSNRVIKKIKTFL